MAHGREDQFEVSLVVNGVSYGVWDRRSGGAREAEGNPYKPGGMRDPIALGGTPMTENVVLGKLSDPGVEAALTPLVGKGTVKIVSQPLDESGLPYGPAAVFEGVLTAVRGPEHNSESTSAAMLEVEASVSAHAHV